MLKIYYGSYPSIKRIIEQLSKEVNMKITYSKNILESVNTQYGLLYTPHIIYTIYDEVTFKKKEVIETFDRLAKQSKSIFIIVVENIDKKSPFYIYYRKRMILIDNEKPSTNTICVDNVANIPPSQAISFLYHIYYTHKKYSSQAGMCLNLVYSGQVSINNILQIFILTIS